MRLVRVIALLILVTAGLAPGLRDARGATSAAPPTLTVTPNAVPIGSSPISVSGSGFTPAAAVTLRLDASSTIGHATVAADGVFSATVTLALHSITHHILSATDTVGLTASQPLYVVAVNLNSTTAGPGTLVAVSGRGFLPAQPISILIGEAVVLNGTLANAAGSFNEVFTVPDGHFGRLPLLIESGAGHEVVFHGIFTVTHAILSVIPEATAHTIALSGKELPPRLAIVIKLDNRTLATTRTTAAGGFAISPLALPASTTPGTHTLLVTDRSGHPLAGTTLTIQLSQTGPTATATATIRPSPTLTHTSTATPTRHPSATVTETPHPSATHTATPLPSATHTLTPHPTMTHTATATFTKVPSATATVTATPTPTRIATATATATLRPTFTASPTPHMTLLVTPAATTAGDRITISGSGYLAGEQIDVQLRTGATGLAALHLAYALADGGGAFRISGVAIPAGTVAGSYRIAAVGQRSARSAEQLIAVTAPKPTLSVSPATVAPEDTVQVSGTNFAPGERVSIFLSSTAGSAAISFGQAQADSAGRFGPVRLRVPFGVPAGAVLIVAAGQSSNRLANASVRINAISPSVIVRPTAVVPGERITVSGSHYQPGETVQVDLVALSSSAHLATAQVNQTGSFTISGLTIPSTTPEGVVSIVVTGTSSRLSANGALSIRPLAARVRPALGSIRAGKAVGLTGSGFIPGETITVQLIGTNSAPVTLGAVVAGTTGSFNLGNVTIPGFVPAGSYTLRAFGQASGRSATSVLIVQAPPPAAPILSILGITRPAGAPYPVSPGSLVQVAGSNFSGGAIVLVVLTGPSGTTPLGAIPATANGSLGPVGLTIPASTTPGSYTLQATVNGQRLATVAVQVRTLTPHLTISPDTLTPGGTVTVQGTGYAPGEQVVLALNGAALPTTPSTILANPSGSFTVTFVVPSSVHNGGNILTAGGTASRAGSSLVAQAELPVATTWYFANGDTTGTAQTTISMLNTTGAPATVQMTFLYQAEPERRYSQIVPAHALATVDLALAAGAGRHIATILQADRQISAQSTVTYGAGDNESALGVSGPSTTWYLAEGYTNRSFRESLEVMNPNPSLATIDVRFLPFNDRPAREARFVMGPRSNIQIDAGQYMPGQSISAIVTADKGVVAERTMRFGINSRGAHDKIGATGASTVWIFAQGESSGDRQTFFTILNPNQAAPAAVTATFFDTNGRPVGERTIVVNALHRGNIKLNDVLPNAQVATVLTSNVPVLVERPEYEGPANLDVARSGSVIFGRNGGSLNWAFPGGSTANGDLAQIFLFNPNLAPVTLRATFYTPSGVSVTQDITMAANSVHVLTVNGIPGLPLGLFGARLQSTNGRVFIAEERSLNPTTQRSSSTQGVAQ